LNIEFKKFKKDASNGLSFEKMQYNVDKNHPREVSISKKSKKKIIKGCSWGIKI
jgi:hypothetical protein